MAAHLKADAANGGHGRGMAELRWRWSEPVKASLYKLLGMDLKQGGAAAYFLVFKDGEALDPAQAPRG